MARRALSAAVIAAGLALASSRCANDPVEVIDGYQYGGNGGSAPVRQGGAPRDTFTAFSKAAATLEMHPGNSASR